MNRQEATKFLRDTLDEQGLRDWHIRLVNDIRHVFLGMCSYKDKCIILNALHIDTHGTEEVINTIRHEVAHALTMGHAHDAVWAEKARALGCDNTNACASYGFDDRAIDAIRSGATVEVTYETEVIRKPTYKISKLQDKCEVCGKVAKELKREEVTLSSGKRKVVITLECLHVVFRDADSQSPFHSITFDGDANCKHTWERTTCTKCGAHKLYDYQIEGARALEIANGRMALFDEMGLGKTIQGLAYLKFHEKDAWPFLWVTKSGIKIQHAREIVRLLGKESFPQVIQTSRDVLIPGCNVLASYDIFRRMDLENLIKHGFKSIVLDECQAIKNPDSTRTQCVRAIARNIPKIIPMSGTFWKNRGSEAFVALNMLDPTLFNSYKEFVDRYVDKFYRGNKVVLGGFYRPKEFREKIKHIAIRRERAEAMPELPQINRTRFVCQVDEYARKAYNDVKDELIKNHNQAVINGEENSKENKMKEFQSLMTMRQILGIAKVPATVELAQEFLEETDRKLVIFVHHVECGLQIKSQLAKWCMDEGHPQPLALTSDLSPEARFAIQQKFNGPNYRLLIASTLASGEGLNLQTCSDCIIHERQWNPANEEQAEGRFIRIGQLSDKVFSTYIHADKSIDTDLDAIVEDKRRHFHASMNKGELPTWQEEDIKTSLINKILKG